MLWILTAVLGYFLFALGNLGDKFVLAGPPKPRSYTFWVAAGGFFVVLLVPFVGLSIPSPVLFGLSVSAGLAYLLGLYCLYTALEDCDVSRVMPALGGFLAIFTLILSSIFLDSKELFSVRNALAFTLLLCGSIAAVWEKGISPAKINLKVVTAAAAFFALNYVLSKMVFSEEGSFWQGLIWMRFSTLFFALVFFARFAIPEALSSRPVFDKKTSIIFLLAQITGGGGALLENVAVALAPEARLPFIIVLQGTQYLFLFLFTLLLSLKFNFFKEKISKQAIIQKITALVLLASGLLLLAV